MASDTKVYLPKQELPPGRGVASYKGGPDVVIVDAKGRQRSAAQDQEQDGAKAIVGTAKVSTGKKAASDESGTEGTGT